MRNEDVNHTKIELKERGCVVYLFTDHDYRKCEGFLNRDIYLGRVCESSNLQDYVTINMNYRFISQRYGGDYHAYIVVYYSDFIEEIGIKELLEALYINDGLQNSVNSNKSLDSFLDKYLFGNDDIGQFLPQRNDEKLVIEWKNVKLKELIDRETHNLGLDKPKKIII